MAISRKEFLQLTFKTVVVIGAGGSIRSFAKGNFSLPDASKIDLRFALASDGHYGQPDTNFDLLHDNMVGWLNAEKKSRGIDFSVINGDLFHNDPKFLSQVKTKWDQLSMPYYVSRGNHDMVDGGTWKNTWNIPLHFAFEKKDSGFLILNTANEKGDYICPDLEWTKSNLESYRKKKHLFVFMHITPFKWTPGGHECPELVELFDKQSNLRAVFHGHDHDQDNAKENNGKYYFFDSHVAGNWGTEYHGYRIVEILKSGDIISYQINPSTGQKINDRTIAMQ